MVIIGMVINLTLGYLRLQDIHQTITHYHWEWVKKRLAGFRKIEGSREVEVTYIATVPYMADTAKKASWKTVEQLQESHNNWVDAQELEDTRMRAWLEGYRFTPDQLKTIASGQMPEHLEPTESGFTWTQLIDDEIEEDELFKLKLALFEKEGVQKSKKAKQKANLRKAETVAEAFYHYASIVGKTGA